MSGSGFWSGIDPRIRFIAVTSGILIVATAWSSAWWRLMTFSLCPLSLLILSGGTWRDLRLRLSVVASFLILAGIFAIVFPGLTGSGGMQTHRFIFLVCVTIFSISSIQLLVTGSNSHATVEAIHRLGMPHDIIWMIVLAIRYVPLIKDEGLRINHAARSRLWSPRKRTMRVMGWMSASVFIRSFERALRTAHAMEIRGYGARVRLPSTHPMTFRDVTFLFLYPGVLFLIRFMRI